MLGLQVCLFLRKITPYLNKCYLLWIGYPIAVCSCLLFPMKITAHASIPSSCLYQYMLNTVNLVSLEAIWPKSWNWKQVEFNFGVGCLLNCLKERRIPHTIYRFEEENNVSELFLLPYRYGQCSSRCACVFAEINEYLYIILNKFSLYRKSWVFMADLMRMQQLKVVWWGRKGYNLDLLIGMPEFVTLVCRVHCLEREESLVFSSFSLWLPWRSCLGFVKCYAEIELR